MNFQTERINSSQYNTARLTYSFHETLHAVTDMEDGKITVQKSCRRVKWQFASPWPFFFLHLSKLTQVRLLGAARDFSPTVNFQCRLSQGVRTPLCAIAYINTCAHVKDRVVCVRVRCIMETLKHPARTVGWVARLCRSWLSPGKATQISHGRSPNGTIHW